MRNLHLTFDWHYIGQKYGGDFAKFFGLLRIYELYRTCMIWDLFSFLQREDLPRLYIGVRIFFKFFEITKSRLNELKF